MDWQLVAGPRGDRATALYQQIRAAVLDARLRPGDRLPATRELAGIVAVSRGTVTAAYERLTAEGFLVGKVGAGTFVARGVRPERRRRAPGGAVRPRTGFPATAPATVVPPAVRVDLSVGMPDPSLFPLATWRRLVSAELRPGRIGAVAYSEPGGQPALRAAIARHLGLARGLRAGADDVVVTSGAQQAFDLVGRVLIEPGDVVAVEEPGYPPVRQLWESSGATVVGVPVDEDGLQVDALPARARLVHVTPSHQFPLGPVLAPARRVALLEWAERRGAVIVEDDYDSEYRYADRPLEPLQARDPHGRVVYVGTFSKTLLPMLRLGFLVAPASLRPALLTARRLADWHGDPVAESALARFIDEGLLARHVRRTAKEYAARRTALLDALPEGWVPWPSAAGLHIAVRVPDAAAVADRAAAQGIRLETLDRYCAGPPLDGLALGIGLARADVITETLTREWR
ncbi:PLP-dependent aminotransferase family protein [Pseudonocardia ailaonensis]|uniref:PLP-dependent aminotransferase family protein n=1 Tax=Pseudonocardia ailaonensis TaxID=367279 RepID=A0ABN2NDJ6_9PSEU